MTATADPTAVPRSRGRSVGSLVAFVLATLLLIPTVVGNWGERTVGDTDRYVATVGPLIEQPAVQEALATAVTGQIVTRLDTKSQVESLLGNVLPENSPLTGALSAPIASGINGLIENLVAKFVASDQFATVWVEFNRAAQQSALRMLDGSNDGIVRLQGEDLVIDVSTALQAIQKAVVDSGITAAENIPLPTTATTITLAHTPALAQARALYQVVSPILGLLPWLVAALFAAAVLLARWRARTVVATGIVFVASMGVLLLSIGAGQEVVTAQLAASPWEAAVDAFWWTLLDFLVAGAQGWLVFGVVLIAAGWFGGRTGSARWVRGHVTTGLADLSGRIMPNRGSDADRPSLRRALRIVAVAVGVGILLVSGALSVGTVLWTSALVAGLLTLVQVFAGPHAPAPRALEPAPSA